MTRSSIKYLGGVDMGGTKILASVIDDQGQILSRSKTATKTHQKPEHIIDRIADRVQSAMRKAKVEKDQVEAIGIGAPGPLDPHTGVVIFAPNLNWNNELAFQLSLITTLMSAHWANVLSAPVAVKRA